MSSKTDNTILLPGASGWELWCGSQDKGFRLELASGLIHASELGRITSSNLIMGFPIRDVLAVPFNVQTTDESLFDDLLEMHLEKSGIRPEEGAGVLTDVFLSEKKVDEAQLLGLVLSAPDRDSMPLTSPDSFGVSVRFFYCERNSITLWCELGRWGFAVTGRDHLTYFQTFSGKSLGYGAARDIHLAVMQLGMEGVECDITNPVVWISEDHPELNPSEAEINDFSAGLGFPVTVEPKPAPTLPITASGIVPADVKAEQRQKAERLKRNLLIAALLCVYIGIASYLAYGYFGLNKKIAAQDKEMEQVKLQHASIQFFNNDWDQLSASVDTEKWPLTALKRTAEQIPTGQDLRFKVFDATPNRVTIRGESAELGLTSTYSEKLKKIMPDYDWSMPQATADAKTNRWKFNYEGTRKGVTE